MFRRVRTIGLVLAVVGVAALIPSSGQSPTDISITPVHGLPFSANVHIEHTLTPKNGAIKNLKNIREIGRDGLGRTFETMRSAVPASQADYAAVVRIHLYDPQSTIATMLDAKTHTFVQKTVEHPPMSSNLVQVSSASAPPQNDFMKEDDLGMAEIDGISVHGLRTQQITPAASSPTGKEIVLVDESWYSPDLHIYMMIKHTDPRRGSFTMTVGELRRGEPDPALFQIPAVYESKY